MNTPHRAFTGRMVRGVFVFPAVLAGISDALYAGRTLHFTESDDNQLNRKRPREAAYWLHDAVNRGMVQSIHADGRYFTNPASIDFSHRISSPFA